MSQKAPAKNSSGAAVARQGHVRAKRAQVQVACEACRKRKVRCDALRPCGSCADRQTPCHYETEVGETYAQASKRKYEEVSQAYDTYKELFDFIRTRNERDVSGIIRRIRSGQDPEAIVKSVATRDAAFALPDPHMIALEMFLVNLAHSTGSLQDIVRLAMESTALIQLPGPQDFRILCNRIVHFPCMESVLRKSLGNVDSILPDSESGIAAGPQLAIDQSETENDDYSTDDDIWSDGYPPYQVPAEPWTTLTTSDKAVSHLVSVFLTWHNPTWSFVETDLFLKGMRSKRLRSDFCSPFLVNSICAIASLQSEHEVAFPNKDGDRISRGQHFHDEAIRLWTLEESRPTIPNMQGLCVLSLESNYRAKDRIGLTLVPIAAQLDREVPITADPRRCADQKISENDYMRARLAAHWMVECEHITMRIAFMSGAIPEQRRFGLPDIQDVFSNGVEVWTGYPLTRSSIDHHPTPYLIERCKLMGILREVHSIILVKGEQRYGTINDFANTVESLAARMHHWYAHIPAELQYEWPMSSAVWELHASYHASLMILRITARSRLLQTGESLDIPTTASDASLETRLAQDNLSKAIPLAHRSAQFLRDFRERYGLKITPAWLLQLQAVAANVLILDPVLANPTLATVASFTNSGGPIQDSQVAFDEVFRSLLGTGVEVMIARAIARMTYHTTQKQRIVLSRSTWNMLQVMSDTAWRPTDVSRVDSTFPNFATIKGHEDNERLTELLSKWESINID